MAPKTTPGVIRDYLRMAYRTGLQWAYARSRFKLFLKAAIGDVDLRVQELASLADLFANLVRPIPIQALFGRSMLVVAPHQDDEMIGCGGALALQVRGGGAAHIVLLHDGAAEHQAAGLSRPELTALRNEESRTAAALLGVQPLFLSYPDLVANAAEAAAGLRAIVQERKVDAVFTPWLLDGHRDHRQANTIVAAALEGVPWAIRVFGYEVWGLCIPNVLVKIDEVIDLKLQMISCFASANRAVDYVHSTKGLNMYRSRLLGAGECRYAECFFELPHPEFIDLARRVGAAGRVP